MPKPNPAVVALFEVYLEASRRGLITDAFVLYRCCDESYEYEYLFGDVPDMLYELGSAILTERIESPAPSR